MSRLTATVASIGALMGPGLATIAEAYEHLPPANTMERQIDKIPGYLSDSHQQRQVLTIRGVAKDLASSGLPEAEVDNVLSDFTDGLREATNEGIIYRARYERRPPVKQLAIVGGLVLLCAAATTAAGIGARRKMSRN